MVKLVAKSPAEGLLPTDMGGVTVREAPFEVLTSLAALKPGLSEALKAAHGMALPKPGRSTGKSGARCLWFGASHYMLAGPESDAALNAYAALTLQTDAWCRVELSGARVVEMLSYLTPIDLRDMSFKRGDVARAQIGHMNSCILRTGSTTFEVMVFRSMAQTLVHELKEAINALP